MSGQGAKLVQMAADALALGFPKAPKRLGHEVVADPEKGEAALKALDDRRAVLAHGVEGARAPDDAGVELVGSLDVPPHGRLIEVHVEPREHVGAAADPPVSARQEHRLGQELLRPYE